MPILFWWILYGMTQWLVFALAYNLWHIFTLFWFWMTRTIVKRSYFLRFVGRDETVRKHFGGLHFILYFTHVVMWNYHMIHLDAFLTLVGEDYLLKSSTIMKWALTLNTDNCEDPRRCLALLFWRSAWLQEEDIKAVNIIILFSEMISLMGRAEQVRE